MMIKLITETLTQLKVVKVQVHSFSIRKQVNLFDSETTVDLSFNGYKHTADYHKYLDKLYDRCKSNLEEQLKEIQSDSVELKRLSLFVTQIDFQLQKLWKFKVDSAYHRFWELPKCQCPASDNLDTFGTGHRYINPNCKIHGKK